MTVDEIPRKQMTESTGLPVQWLINELIVRSSMLFMDEHTDDMIPLRTTFSSYDDATDDELASFITSIEGYIKHFQRSMSHLTDEKKIKSMQHNIQILTLHGKLADTVRSAKSVIVYDDIVIQNES